MKIEINDKWINTDEMAEYLGAKVTALRECIKKSNGISVHKIGCLWKLKKRT